MPTVGKLSLGAGRARTHALCRSPPPPDADATRVDEVRQAGTRAEGPRHRVQDMSIPQGIDILHRRRSAPAVESSSASALPDRPGSSPHPTCSPRSCRPPPHAWSAARHRAAYACSEAGRARTDWASSCAPRRELARPEEFGIPGGRAARKWPCWRGGMSVTHSLTARLSWWRLRRARNSGCWGKAPHGRGSFL